MHKPKESLPVRLEGPNTKLCAVHGWGKMSIAYGQMPAGTDLGPLLQGLTNDACHCPHWGYILKGSLHVRYTDGSEEVVSAGEVFYLPPGHTGWMDEETAYIEFSPDPEYKEVLNHVLKKAGVTG